MSSEERTKKLIELEQLREAAMISERKAEPDLVKSVVTGMILGESVAESARRHIPSAVAEFYHYANALSNISDEQNEQTFAAAYQNAMLAGAQLADADLEGYGLTPEFIKYLRAAGELLGNLLAKTETMPATDRMNAIKDAFKRESE